MSSTSNNWNIAGKEVLITGATSGIGKAAAFELARMGAKLSVLGRDRARMEALGVDARLFQADLSQLAQVRSVAAEIGSVLGRIDVLVNNAGVAARGSRTTSEGFDEMLAANYLGPFLLTHLLLDRVRASAPARIVITGSEAHRLAGRFDPENFEAMGEYSGLSAQLAYGRTKLLDVLFGDELGRRLRGSGVTANSLCPGLVNTGLVREVPGADRISRLLSATPVVRTPEQGARMLIRLAAGADVEGRTGSFHTSTPGMRVLPPVPSRRNPAVASRVYERTCDLVGVTPLPAQ
jgi:NAD(P)-dependent dehydrogenase (short-subunit alcohol dehydrogenase family)